MNIQKFFKHFTKFFLDIIFPIKCLNCGQEKVYLCPDCLNKIHITSKIIIKTASHQNLPWWLNGIIITANYQESKILRQAIHILKYKFVEDLARPLGQLMRKRLEAVSRVNLTDFIVIPIPLHKRRLAERGFNQNILIASYCFNSSQGQFIQKNNKMFDSNILIRKHYTKPQVNLNRPERIKNINNAFVVKSDQKDKIKGRKFLLVDDILTTGATLNQAAGALKQAGASEVWGLVLAED